MEEQIKNVLIAGPNGSLGAAIIRQLKEHNFNISLLTRSLEKTETSFPGIPAYEANYDSVEGLIKLLRDGPGKQDALIILISRDEAQGQINLIDAAIATGTTHIIPSAFGFSTRHPWMRDTPVLLAKARMEDHLIQKAEEGQLTYTQIQTMAFFDWALDRGIYLNTTDPNAPTIVFDGGDIRLSVTNVDDAAKAVAVSLEKVDQVKNRDVNVHTAVVTQNQLLACAREAAPNREFKVIDVDTAEAAKEAMEKYKNGDTSKENMRAFLARTMFGNDIGVHKETDNELLGIPQWNDDQVKSFIAGYFK